MRQCARAVLMIEPAAFDYNPETAASNRLQRRSDAPAAELRARALAEFHRLAATLRGAGVRVCVVPDTADPPKPDAIFPNNWLSFHEDGTLVLYPMAAPSRRRERRPEVIAAMQETLAFEVRRVLDLTHHEAAGRFLEGTGSLVLDRVNRIAYACASPRTDPQLAEEWAHALGYEPVVFSACDPEGVPLYHTNVVLCIGERVAVVGAAAIAASDRDRVLERLTAGGREVLAIDQAAIAAFAGNMLELAGDAGGSSRRLLVMSASAHAALPEASRARLAAGTDELLVVPVPTIERLGGGSVRCMLAEVFLPA